MKTLPFLLVYGSFFFISCFSAGVYKEGGFVSQPFILPAVSRIGNAPYRVLCKKDQIAKIPEQHTSLVAPDIYGVDPAHYLGGCRQIGSDSVFILFHMFPLTRQLDPDYALSNLVASIEGDTAISVQAWKETHIYGILGRAIVWKVSGEVIRYENRNIPEQKNEKQPVENKPKRQRQ